MNSLPHNRNQTAKKRMLFISAILYRYSSLVIVTDMHYKSKKSEVNKKTK